MPIHMGIVCEACRKVHFIATSPDIQLSRPTEGIYKFVCKPPCPEAREFRKEGMYPYRVSDDVFRRGYADEGEYEFVAAKWKEPPKGR
jgi:hypothetical protein